VKCTSTLDREQDAEVVLTAQHPATRAWCKLTKSQVVPDRVETIQESLGAASGQASVYRLTNIGPGKSNVIAKRCETAAASAESLIYENVLPYLPVSMLRFYGRVADDDQQFCWLLLEDAGEKAYLSEREEHRVLAGHWLGLMNISAQQLGAAATRLPDRGTGFYLERLLESREVIRKIDETGNFKHGESAVLRTAISHCDALERRWLDIERFCNRMPQTLVHGDLLAQNVRLRTGPAGNGLLMLDWEGAGWGVPAADLVQFMGKSLSPDLPTYYSVVRSSWPHLAFTDVESLADVGRMFRLINSLDWANWGFRAIGAEWFMEKLNWCERELAGWLRSAEARDS
jgi:hypothetical protein